MRNMIFLSICIFAYLDVVCSLFQYCFHKNPMLIVSKLLGISLHIVSLDVHLYSGNNNYTKYSNGQQYLFCHFVAIPHVHHNLQFYLVIKLLCSSENECFVFYIISLLYSLQFNYYICPLNLSFRSFGGGGNYAMQSSEMVTMGMEIPGQPTNKKSKAVGETR